MFLVLWLLFAAPRAVRLSLGRCELVVDADADADADDEVSARRRSQSEGLMECEWL